MMTIIIHLFANIGPLNTKMTLVFPTLKRNGVQTLVDSEIFKYVQ